MIGLGAECDEGDVTNLLLQREFRRHYRMRRPQKFIARFDSLLEALAAPRSVRDWAVAGSLLLLIELILRETSPRLRRITEASETGAEQARQAQEWARATNIAPALFYQVFKANIGLSPKQWLQRQRLQTASQYLLSTRLNVTEVARKVGFEDPFYFSRLFDRHFGKSPLQWRKSNTATSCPQRAQPHVRQRPVNRE